jgi:hypothetical protein
VGWYRTMSEWICLQASPSTSVPLSAWYEVTVEEKGSWVKVGSGWVRKRPEKRYGHLSPGFQSFVAAVSDLGYVATESRRCSWRAGAVTHRYLVFEAYQSPAFIGIMSIISGPKVLGGQNKTSIQTWE